MTGKRLLIAFASIAALAVVAAVVVIAAQLPSHDKESPAASTPAATASTEPTTAEQAFHVADLFCRPDASPSVWQRELTPYLTPDAARLYAAVDPGNVPCAGVQGDGAPVGDQQTSTDQAFQFTAATGGRVTVTLHRDTEQAEWLASYIDAGS
ncbi:hypothetical protein RI685_15905 (plasmid) [Clavibacter michiganensis]|uniref:hypothetical protein n=1 Tax=Clavibacter michiganensis TaxID=28447 RepID=UPI0014312870|nr:hypothetical protein [Clavibacter michiganensis]QIT16162.1 hypothetical protein GRD61_15740 [Clavibacter michiganensis subsp. michiganensis]